MICLIYGNYCGKSSERIFLAIKRVDFNAYSFMTTWIKLNLFKQRLTLTIKTLSLKYG